MIFPLLLFVYLKGLLPGGFSTYTLVLMSLHVLQQGQTVLCPRTVQRLCEETRVEPEAMQIWCHEEPVDAEAVGAALRRFFAPCPQEI